jgi:hypothetical protein
MPNKRTCKRRRVKRNSDGSYNEEDIKHNRNCEAKYMIKDNAWMKPILRNKKPKGSDKYLKMLLKKRIKTLKNSSTRK